MSAATSARANAHRARPDRSLLVLGAFPACLPVGFVSVGPVQVVELIALVIAGLVLADRWLTRRLVAPPVGALWVVAVVAAAAVATPLSVHEDATFRADVQLALGVLLAAATFQAVDSWRDLRLVLCWLSAAAALIAVLALPEVGQQQAQFGGAVVSGRVTGIFAQPNEFGLFVAMALMLAMTPLSAQHLLVRVLSRGTVLILLVSLAVSLSRGAWLGAIAGTAGLVLLVPTTRRRLLRSLAPALVLLAVVLAVAPTQPQLSIFTSRVQTITERAENPYDERPAIYAEAIRLAADRPWTGQGPGTFPFASASSIREGALREEEHAHNALLTVAAEAGLLGVVAVVGLTLSVLISVLRTCLRVSATGALRDTAAVAGTGAALLVVVGHGVIDYPLRNPVIFLLVWMLVGLAFASDRLADTRLVARHREEPHG